MITQEDLEAMGYNYNGEDPRNDFVLKVQEFIDTMGQDPKPVLYAGLIQEEFDEWRSSYWQNDEENQLKELTDLLYVCVGYAISKGWDITESFQRVHDNNIGRCIQPDGTIKRRDDGKIIKNKDFPKVYLGDLV